MESTSSNVVIFEALHRLREQFAGALRLQAEEISRLEQGLELLRDQHREAVEATRRLLEGIEQTLTDTANVFAPSIQTVWGSIRNLMKATHAEQVFEVLAAETAQMNVRTVVFDVRGKAAWASSAGGFGSALSNQDLRSLVAPLNQENPFRQVFETAEPLKTSAEGLGRNRNVLETLRPAPSRHIWLVPIQSAESVTAILYGECGAGENPILADALKLLAEFAGAQLDRLTVFSRGFAHVEPAPREERVRVPEPAAAPAPEGETAAVASGLMRQSPEITVPEPSPEVAANPPAGEALAASVSLEAQDAPAAEPEPVSPKAPDIIMPSEEELKARRDAQRFSRLLVSEIELYNKEEVKQGRKNKDLYQRLKRDIDRSRQTYEKRFGHTVVKQVDYFHEELVRALAGNDPSLLGSDYPGPSV